MVLQLWRANKVPCLRGLIWAPPGSCPIHRDSNLQYADGILALFRRFVQPRATTIWRMVCYNSAVHERDLARELENLSIAPYRGLTLAVVLDLPDEPNAGSEKTEGAASLLSRATLRGQAQRGCKLNSLCESWLY